MFDNMSKRITSPIIPPYLFENESEVSFLLSFTKKNCSSRLQFKWKKELKPNNLVFLPNFLKENRNAVSNQLSNKRPSNPVKDSTDAMEQVIGSPVH